MARVAHQTLPETFSRDVARYAWRAMLAEVNLTPKPGLVDCHNSGAHRDMDRQTFHRSASAIAEGLPAMVELGAACARLTATETLLRLRTVGQRCEEAMFHATAGVNTHKGTLFTLGLFCAAIGRHAALGLPLSADALAATVAGFCQGIVERELVTLTGHSPLTAGQRLFITHGLTGARGEAERGYPLVINFALPFYRQCRRQGLSDTLALHNTLLLLIAYNHDTNVVSRGGLGSLRWIQQRASMLLATGGIRSSADLPRIEQFDDACIARNLSPGGSADLLILTWFLFHFDLQEKHD